MKYLFFLSVGFLFLFSCDDSAGKSFYMTYNDAEVTNINCNMNSLKIRVDLGELISYTTGDLLIRFEMMTDGSEVVGEGTGEYYVYSDQIPDDKLVWIDLNPENNKVENYATGKPYNIFGYCEAREGASHIRVTYYSVSDSGEEKVGYEDQVILL